MQIDGISPHLAARYQLGWQFLAESADSGNGEVARVDKLPKRRGLRLQQTAGESFHWMYCKVGHID